MKTLGLILVFIFFSTAGIVKSVDFTKSKEELYAFIQFFKFVRREIVLHRTRQLDIYKKFGNKVLEKNGFLNSLRQGYITDSRSVLYHTFSDYEKKLSISTECKNLILEFAESFGQISVSEQSQKCDTLIFELEDIYKKEKEEAVLRAKASRYLGVMAGIGAVLLLI